MIPQDVIATALFQAALKATGNVEKALESLARAGKLAEVYLGPFSGSVWSSLEGLESSSSAEEVPLGAS